MAAQIVSATEDFVRSHFATAIEEHRPIGPVTKTMLDVLMTETANHVGADELRGSKATDPARYVLKVVLATLAERYSLHRVTVFLRGI